MATKIFVNLPVMDLVRILNQALRMTAAAAGGFWIPAPRVAAADERDG